MARRLSRFLFSALYWPDKSSAARNFCPDPIGRPRIFVSYFLRATHREGYSALDKTQRAYGETVPKLAKPSDKREIQNPHFIYTQGIYVYKHFISFGKSGFTATHRSSGIFKATLRERK